MATTKNRLTGGDWKRPKYKSDKLQTQAVIRPKSKKIGDNSSRDNTPPPPPYAD